MTIISDKTIDTLTNMIKDGFFDLTKLGTEVVNQFILYIMINQCINLISTILLTTTIIGILYKVRTILLKDIPTQQEALHDYRKESERGVRLTFSYFAIFLITTVSCVGIFNSIKTIKTILLIKYTPMIELVKQVNELKENK